MIKQYGVMLLRFILSDSPPDVIYNGPVLVGPQQIFTKIWNLNYSIFKRKKKRSKDIEKTFFTDK